MTALGQRLKGSHRANRVRGTAMTGRNVATQRFSASGDFGLVSITTTSDSNTLAKPLSGQPLYGQGLRFPGAFSPASGRPFKGLGHSAKLAVEMRYRQILAREPSIEIYIQHVLF
jgi:hypothetical protein